MASRTRRRLGDLLIEAGLLTDEQLRAALAEQKKWGGRLGRTVVELGFVTESALAQVLARQLDLPSIDLDTAELPADAPRWLRLDLAERYLVFPLAFNQSTRTLTVASADPTNLEAVQAIEFATRLKVVTAVATATAIERAIRRHYFGEQPVSSSPSKPPAPKPAPVLSSPSPAPIVPGTASFELDELMGEVPFRTMTPAPVKPAAAVNSIELSLRRELAVLREKVDGLEQVNASQVRALRMLLELLIESGLVTRDEYLEKLNAPE